MLKTWELWLLPLSVVFLLNCAGQHGSRLLVSRSPNRVANCYAVGWYKGPTVAAAGEAASRGGADTLLLVDERRGKVVGRGFICAVKRDKKAPAHAATDRAAKSGTSVRILLMAASVPDESETLIPRVAVDNALAKAMADLGRFLVITHEDINLLLTREKRQDLLGCDDSSCMAEVGHALGAEYLMQATVSPAGDHWAVSLNLVDSQEGVAMRRNTQLVPANMASLLDHVPFMVRQLMESRVNSP